MSLCYFGDTKARLVCVAGFFGNELLNEQTYELAKEVGFDIRFTLV